MSRSAQESFREITDQPRRPPKWETVAIIKGNKNILAELRSQLLESIEGKQYIGMLKALRIFGISIAGVPTFAALKKGLTAEVLGKALKLEEPTLCLTPPLTRQQMIEAIDSQRGRSKLIRKKTFIYQPDNDFLWNEGQAETNLQWEVNIEEGKQDIPFDEQIFWTGKPGESEPRTNQEQVKLWMQKYTDHGLDIMSGTRRNLTVIMKGLAGRKAIDNGFWTLINPQSVSKDPNALRADSCWGDGWVSLRNGTSNFFGSCLRVRPSVRVKL